MPVSFSKIRHRVPEQYNPDQLYTCQGFVRLRSRPAEDGHQRTRNQTTINRYFTKGGHISLFLLNAVNKRAEYTTLFACNNHAYFSMPKKRRTSPGMVARNWKQRQNNCSQRIRL